MNGLGCPRLHNGCDMLASLPVTVRLTYLYLAIGYRVAQQGQFQQSVKTPYQTLGLKQPCAIRKRF